MHSDIKTPSSSASGDSKVKFKDKVDFLNALPKRHHKNKHSSMSIPSLDSLNGSTYVLNTVVNEESISNQSEEKGEKEKKVRFNRRLEVHEHKQWKKTLKAYRKAANEEVNDTSTNTAMNSNQEIISK